MQWRMFGAGAVCCAAAASGLVWQHQDAVAAQQAQAHQVGQSNRAAFLPGTPGELLHTLYAVVGGNRSDGCLLFSDAAAAQLAAAGGGSCASAISQISTLVTDRPRYVNDLHYDYATTIKITGDTGTIDACAVTWTGFLGSTSPQDPGPKLGHLTVNKQYGQQGNGWQITSVTPCTPTPGSTTAPPTGGPIPPAPTAPPPPAPTSTVPAILPSYAPGFAGILAGRISRGDDLCDLMNDTGRAQFLAARGAPDCAAAVANLHAKVTDPDLYGNPDPTTVTTVTTPNGHATVNACHMAWSTFVSKTPPGPQIGVLELQKPPGNVGYQIVGFRHC